MDDVVSSLSTWVQRLRSLAAPGLPERFLELQRSQPAASPDLARAWIAAFRDGEGNRRAVDGPLLAHMLSVQTTPPLRTPTPESRVWALLTQAVPNITDTAVDWTGTGRLFPSLAESGIEAWTEAELASLQALAWIALRQRSSPLMHRAMTAAKWLASEVQPDNATQHPWAAGFFIARSTDTALSSRERQEYALYAHTLIENALVGREHPDVFSACILWDSAAWMESLAASAWRGPPAWIEALTRG